MRHRPGFILDQIRHVADMAPFVFIPRHIFQNQETLLALDGELNDAHNVRVFELHLNVGFAREKIEQQRCVAFIGRGRAQRFDRYLLLVFCQKGALGQIDRPHPARADFADDAVAAHNFAN